MFGLFKSSPKTSTTISNLKWSSLTDVNQIEELMDLSEKKAVIVFKHSTRCHISKMVLRNFESESKAIDQPVALYFLDLLKYREVSDEVSSSLGVRHESPQLIIIKDRQVVHHDSHHRIKASTISDYS